MRRRIVYWAVVLALLGMGSSSRGEEIFFSDVRMVEANAALSNRAQYPRAIALYRDVLREFPSHATARLWLARVLSWSGEHEASLAEYDRLLDLDPPAADLDLERAEVLSWAGRYDEALAAFDAILAERPQEQRALVGKARTYTWAGRRAEAARTYQAALAFSEDPEVRRELASLRGSLEAGGDARGRHFFDSDGFSRTTALSTTSVDLTFDTRFVGELAYGRVGRDQTSSVLQSLGAASATNGVAGLLGLERRLRPEVVVSAMVGYAWWESAPGQLQARGTFDASLPSDTAIGFQLDYGGFLDWSDAYEALVAGIDGTNLRASVWQGLGDRWSVFGYAETTFIGDGNQRVAVGGSADCRPLSSLDLTVGLAASVLTYTNRSPFYYDPSIDVGTEAFGRIDQPLTDWMRAFAEVSVGMGQAEQGGLEGFGVTYGVTGGARLLRGGLELELRGGRSQSQRASVYTSYHLGAALNLVF